MEFGAAPDAHVFEGLFGVVRLIPFDLCFGIWHHLYLHMNWVEANHGTTLKLLRKSNIFVILFSTLLSWLIPHIHSFSSTRKLTVFKGEFSDWERIPFQPCRQWLLGHWRLANRVASPSGWEDPSFPELHCIKVGACLMKSVYVHVCWRDIMMMMMKHCKSLQEPLSCREWNYLPCGNSFELKKPCSASMYCIFCNLQILDTLHSSLA